MAKLILKSISYYPQAQAELPMSHKNVGFIDTDKPYKKLIISTKSRHLYRLVDQQTGEVLKAQKLIRDHNDLKIYVGEVIVVETRTTMARPAAAPLTQKTVLHSTSTPTSTSAMWTRPRSRVPLSKSTRVMSAVTH